MKIKSNPELTPTLVICRTSIASNFHISYINYCIFAN